MSTCHKSESPEYGASSEGVSWLPGLLWEGGPTAVLGCYLGVAAQIKRTQQKENHPTFCWLGLPAELICPAAAAATAADSLANSRTSISKLSSWTRIRDSPGTFWASAPHWGHWGTLPFQVRDYGSRFPCCFPILPSPTVGRLFWLMKHPTSRTE